MSERIILKAEGLHKSYRQGTVETQVLKGLDMHLNEGEVVAVTGRSGAGKSTLLHLVALLDTPNEGQVIYNGTPVAGLSGKQRASTRNSQFGFIFQAYHLISELNALENVVLPAMMLPGYISKRAEYRDRAFGLLEKLGLAERVKHTPLQLSGGERQRVAIARAMMNNPRILFCDEPTGNLDEKSSRVVFDAILQLREEENLSMLIVTHERPYAEAADRVYVIRNGKAALE